MKREGKKLILEENMNKERLADAKERLAEEKAYLKLRQHEYEQKWADEAE